MKLTVGENIRALRRERNITQEEFAAAFGVSYQSVSRWENDLCYPDIELLPEIAAFFAITVDQLLGADRQREQRDVERYCARFQQAISRGEIGECIVIAREGVAAYPNNYKLLCKLMYALFVAGDDDGNIPAWQENREGYDAEITALGERIVKYCPDQDIRLEATALLAFNHCEMGRKTQGRQVYETLPSMEYCRENRIWWALEPEEKEPFLREKIRRDFDNLESSVWLLGTAGCLPDEEAVVALNKVLALQELVTDGAAIRNDWGASRLQFDLARCYARLGAFDLAMEHLFVSAGAAKAFDARPEEQSYTCALLGTVTERRGDFQTSDTRPLREILRDKWLGYSEFDPIRHTPEFRALLEQLA